MKSVFHRENALAISSLVGQKIKVPSNCLYIWSHLMKKYLLYVTDLLYFFLEGLLSNHFLVNNFMNLLV